MSVIMIISFRCLRSLRLIGIVRRFYLRFAEYIAIVFLNLDAVAQVLVFNCRKVLEINCRKLLVSTCFLHPSTWDDKEGAKIPQVHGHF